MHRTIKQSVRHFSVKIQERLKKQTGDRLIRRAYKPNRDGTPHHALDPRKNRILFSLRQGKKNKRPTNFVFDHDWSYSVTWEGLRLRVTTYNIKPKQEKILVKVLQEIATEHDIVIIIDVTRNAEHFRNDHWGKYRIAPKGRRRK